jgi:hypothetical protein
MEVACHANVGPAEAQHMAKGYKSEKVPMTVGPSISSTFRMSGSVPKDVICGKIPRGRSEFE